MSQKKRLTTNTKHASAEQRHKIFTWPPQMSEHIDTGQRRLVWFFTKGAGRWRRPGDVFKWFQERTGLKIFSPRLCLNPLALSKG